eukprot:5305919-Prymnesium_polylepis.1
MITATLKRYGGRRARNCTGTQEGRCPIGTGRGHVSPDQLVRRKQHNRKGVPERESRRPGIPN